MKPDDSVAADAAVVLGRVGSAGSKQALIDRLRVPSPDSILDIRIIEALFDNKAFGLTSEEVLKIRPLCAIEDCRTEIDRLSPKLK